MLNPKMVTNTQASKHIIFLLITDVIFYRGTEKVNWTFSMIMFYFFTFGCINTENVGTVITRKLRTI